MKSHDRRLPRDREVAQFVCLHFNTVAVQQKHPHKRDHWVYSVEGKSRPMIVLRKLTTREHGRAWFVVLPVTKSGRDERGNVKDGYIPIGNCLDASIHSFVKIEQQQTLPDNMLDQTVGDNGIVGICDPLGFNNAIKVLGYRLLQNGFPIERG